MPSSIKMLSLTAASILLLACDRSPESSSAEVSSQAFATALRAHTNTPEAVVDCFSELAAEELSDRSIALLIASMKDEDETMRALRETMPVAELTQAGMFMVSAGSRCGAAEDMD